MSLLHYYVQWLIFFLNLLFSSLGNKNHNNEDDEKREIQEFINSVEIIDESILIGYGIMYKVIEIWSVNGKGINPNRKIYNRKKLNGELQN